MTATRRGARIPGFPRPGASARHAAGPVPAPDAQAGQRARHATAAAPLPAGVVRGAAPVVLAVAMGTGLSVAPAAATGSHTVAAGETLSAIAKRYGTTVGALAELNGLTNRNLIVAGATLRVPPPPTRTVTVTHTVRSGENLTVIARRHGTSVAALRATNRLSGDLIHPGQQLVVGRRTEVVGTASPQRQPQQQPQASAENTFEGRTYPDSVVAAARRNREVLAGRDLPSKERMREIIAATAREHGVDPSIALAISYQEAGFQMDVVSVANAVGAMQVIPSTGEWISTIVGRPLDLLDPQDNATAGVVLLKVLLRQADERDAVAGYYQGLASVRRNGMFEDTQRYVDNVMALRPRFR